MTATLGTQGTISDQGAGLTGTMTEPQTRASPAAGVIGTSDSLTDPPGNMTLSTAQAAVEAQLTECVGPAFNALARAQLLAGGGPGLTRKVAAYAATLLRENWQGGG